MDENRLWYLFHRYYDKTATAAEIEDLRQCLREAADDDRLTALLKEAWDELQEDAGLFLSEERADMLNAILQAGSGGTPIISMTVDARPDISLSADAIPDTGLSVDAALNAGRSGSAFHRARWWRIAAAAVVALGCVVGYRWYAHPKAGQAPALAQQVIKHIPPGGNKAVLILANGSAIALDSASSGEISVQGGTQVLKQKDGQLAYRQARTATQTPVYNTIATPRGGQYKVLLPDGSRVWLNAASSLRFPTVFSGKDREVFVTGEVYFEVAPNKSKPFRVQAKGTTVEVLGTHFNVMAYDDEKVLATTLLEGSVRVLNGKTQTLIAPGQQAAIDNRTGDLKVAPVDTGEVVAWKNGQFTFRDLDIESIMRQLSRWYNIDVRFEGSVAPRQIRGSISRDYDISEVLQMLEFTTGISYRIEKGQVMIHQN